MAIKVNKRLVSLTAPASLEAEQYQNLRLKLQRLKAARDIRMIALTSPTSGDGKTLSAINVAGALARGSGSRPAAPEPGQRAKAGVLLIDADLRRPAVARQLGVAEDAPGLADLVVDGNMALADVVQPLDFGFSVIPAGAPTIPIHLIFESPRLEQLLREARDTYDFVVLDTPPFLPVSDSRLLAQWVDGLILVVAAHKTPRKLLEETLNLLDGSTVLGILFNRDDRPFFGYRRHYYRGYFPQTGAGRPEART
jgi:capsular exopolysaccharide synthesis family protein